MQLADLIRASGPPEPWAEGDNIPWNEPEFSARMLREHLSAEHDMASRRGEMIDRQVAWIGAHLLGGRTTRILDLACGPGLYGRRLAAGGHEYVGIDYSPASIAHAQQENAAGTDCTYIEQDVRQADFGRGFGLVMMLYGELNVFRPADVRAILAKAHAALQPGGLLLLEPHTRDAVVAIGDEPRAWVALETGLFSDQPHLYLQEGYWDEKHQAATRRFFVIDAATGEVERYAASYQAYSDGEYRTVLAECGFEDVTLYPSLLGEADSTQPSMLAISARKAAG